MPELEEAEPDSEVVGVPAGMILQACIKVPVSRGKELLTRGFSYQLMQDPNCTFGRHCG